MRSVGTHGQEVSKLHTWQLATQFCDATFVENFLVQLTLSQLPFFSTRMATSGLVTLKCPRLERVKRRLSASRRIWSGNRDGWPLLGNPSADERELVGALAPKTSSAISNPQWNRLSENTVAGTW